TARDDEACAVVVSSAASALADAESADGKGAGARPSVLRPLHVLVPIAIVALVVVARAPMPPRPAPPAAPGETKVQMADVEGLRKVAQLGQIAARDDAQRARLDRIAKDAEKLRADLQKGL